MRSSAFKRGRCSRDVRLLRRRPLRHRSRIFGELPKAPCDLQADEPPPPPAPARRGARAPFPAPRWPPTGSRPGPCHVTPPHLHTGGRTGQSALRAGAPPPRAPPRPIGSSRLGHAPSFPLNTRSRCGSADRAGSAPGRRRVRALPLSGRVQVSGARAPPAVPGDLRDVWALRLGVSALDGGARARARPCEAAQFPPAGALGRPGPGFARYFHPAAPALCAAATGGRSGAPPARAVHTPYTSPPCTDLGAPTRAPEHPARRPPPSLPLHAAVPRGAPCCEPNEPPRETASRGGQQCPRKRALRPHRADPGQGGTLTPRRWVPGGGSPGRRSSSVDSSD
ncbi:translation initiation factor IF-2-like [Herpailurus yagouaroundi]|uniref:translation initiation factor IF-2-like n=1 Tax=Herpailurus yagouaroundi TaxID=1608482 RepID=UPI001AD77F13|nr:translation initiation factor IF-2-like [Puma yagouaroundi]